MKEEYVSIWDDDILPKTQWLQYSVEYSKQNGDALVGGNGRTFIRLRSNNRMVGGPSYNLNKCHRFNHFMIAQWAHFIV